MNMPQIQQTSSQQQDPMQQQQSQPVVYLLLYFRFALEIVYYMKLIFDDYQNLCLEYGLLPALSARTLHVL